MIQPTLRPIENEDAQKVAAAMRQSSENGKMMSKLLQRVQVGMPYLVEGRC